MFDIKDIRVFILLNEAKFLHRIKAKVGQLVLYKSFAIEAI